MTPDAPQSSWKKGVVWLQYHQLVVLVAGAIMIALVLTSIGLALYNSTGTAQLDLSRPDYEGVGEVVQQDKTVFTEYQATGAVNQTALDEFSRLYKEKLDNIRSVDAFSGDPMALDALGIDEATVDTTSSE